MIRTGLVGRSILASRSPWLHEEEARAQGFALSYTLFDFDALDHGDDQLEPLLRRLVSEGYGGVNVTFPFKQAIMPLLDAVADEASQVGAVNTVAMHGGRLVGHNTDKTGFQDSIAEHLPDIDLGHVLLLGAGGAGAAVANALVALGAGRLDVVDADATRARALVAALEPHRAATDIRAFDMASVDTGRVDGIVNATPLGMASKPGMAIAAASIAPRHWVADIVYFPLETELLRVARAKGCRTIDGSGMVVGQAAAAFEIFTGRTADRERMRRSFGKG